MPLGALAPIRRLAFVHVRDVGGPAATSLGSLPVAVSTPFPAKPVFTAPVVRPSARSTCRRQAVLTAAFFGRKKPRR